MGKTDLGLLGAISEKATPVVVSSWERKNLIKAKDKDPQSFRKRKLNTGVLVVCCSP